MLILKKVLCLPDTALGFTLAASYKVNTKMTRIHETYDI